ncbi:hypothetical protein HBI30_136540 [Parastagonospora nodorum]|nr:hypothetical protein HBI30_136540 [Parastagonospora nodorum]
MAYDAPVLIPTLVGSLLSCVATTGVLISYIIYAEQQKSFRHALVLNLALAEFINSLNNSISGLYVLTRGKTTPSAACTLNGWMGQWSVQAADFSILAIAIITLLTITRKTYMPNTSLMRKILICASVWIIPTITASTAAGLNEIKPVSGNWCWISGKRTDLRYALGHGWRFAIIFVTIGIYSYIWIYMRRHFRELKMVTSTRSKTNGSSLPRRPFGQKDAFELRSESQTELHEMNVEYRFEVSHAQQGPAHQGATTHVDLEARDGANSEKAISVLSDKGKNSVPNSPTRTTIVETTTEAAQPGSPIQRRTRDVEREIKKMLLLNAYPVLYVILWTPGLLNRLVEATGHKSRVLSIMQASTQFIGLANAITYGINGDLRKSLQSDVRRFFRRR